jgi:hypothetical protein
LQAVERGGQAAERFPHLARGFIRAVADGQHLGPGQRLAQQLCRDDTVTLLLLDHQLGDHRGLQRTAAQAHRARHHADEAYGARAFHRHPGGERGGNPGVGEEYLVEVGLARGV